MIGALLRLKSKLEKIFSSVVDVVVSLSFARLLSIPPNDKVTSRHGKDGGFKDRSLLAVW
jgi:hypothetical protein